MHPDLSRLIELQRLDTAMDAARREIADHPRQAQALESRIAAATDALAAARQRLEDRQTARRDIDKNLAVMQARLSKFKDQLMAVKTNKEYHAVQSEIGFAEGEVRQLEDQLLESMVETDSLVAAVKTAEKALAAEQQAVTADRKALEIKSVQLEQQVERDLAARTAAAAAVAPEAIAIFDRVSKMRKGLAVAEARAERCTVCQVRIRPHVFNAIRRNEAIIQCESCTRILFFNAPVEGAASAPPQAASC